MELHIISCSKDKTWDDPTVRARFVAAEQAYLGPEITAWLSDPRVHTSRWLILSARYGFISPDQPIENYDVTFDDEATGPVTLETLARQVRCQQRWADQVPLRQFRRIVVHGTSTYVEAVRAAFASLGAEVVPAETAGKD